MPCWFMDEWVTANLNDKRLNDRFRDLLEMLGDRPSCKDPPGVETLWKGMQRMQDLAWAWKTFGPGVKKE